MLGCNIERLSQEVEGAQYPCLCSCSGSHPWSKSLDRHQRSLSQDRLERQVTFWEPEVEPDSSERAYTGPWGHSFGMHLEETSLVPPPTQSWEAVHPWEMPTAYSDVRGGRDYLPEPSIRNIEVWLDWQAHQIDMPHWWAELIAIPDVENPKRLAQQICTSFSILEVRCEAFPGQEYTMPPAPKCLTRGSFLPNDLSYQDT